LYGFKGSHGWYMLHTTVCFGSLTRQDARVGSQADRLLVNPDSARLNNPQVTGRSSRCESVNKSQNKNRHRGEEVVRAPKNHQALSGLGGIPQHIREIEIESYKYVAS